MKYYYLIGWGNRAGVLIYQMPLNLKCFLSGQVSALNMLQQKIMHVKLYFLIKLNVKDECKLNACIYAAVCVSRLTCML